MAEAKPLYFDAQTHYLSIIELSGITIELGDYQKVDGISYPAKTTVTVPNGPTIMTATFEKLIHGIEVDNAIFKMPN